jgi:hypothetical protein
MATDKRPGFKKKVDIESSKNMVSDILKETDKTLTQNDSSKNEKRMRRINAEIPLEVWEVMDKHITNEGYNLKGFLTKILKEYFSMD